MKLLTYYESTDKKRREDRGSVIILFSKKIHVTEKSTLPHCMGGYWQLLGWGKSMGSKK